MIFNRKMRIGKTVTDVDETMRMLNNGTSVFNIYLILVDRTNNSLMEIIKSSQIFHDIFKYKKFEVIAIANGEAEAFELVSYFVMKNLKAVNNSSEFKKVFY